LAFASAPETAAVELYNERGEDVASANGTHACFQTAGLGPGIYFAHIRAQTQAGSDDVWQKIIVLGR
jgi:hypothetical protein